VARKKRVAFRLKHGKKLGLPFIKSRVPSQNEAESPATKRFASVEKYLRTMHPEYDFVFDLKQHARERWHYSEKQAEVTQVHMIETPSKSRFGQTARRA
jgi:hypothetical protein